jgi:hypothetical protein
MVVAKARVTSTISPLILITHLSSAILNHGNFRIARMAAVHGITVCAAVSITTAKTDGVKYIESHRGRAELAPPAQSMKSLAASCLIILSALPFGCSTAQRAQGTAQRKPLEKQRREYQTPTQYEPREYGYDQKSGKPLTCDYKPRVELLDDKLGKYAFKWLGYDRKEKSVIFQRGDVLDVIASASVSKESGNQYLYTYTVENLPTSATYLKRFVVQNFASDVVPKQGPFMAFKMSKAISVFKDGNWLSFDDVSDGVQINPGQKVQIELRSSAPPGVVQCKASIQTVIEGGGEEMPSALENLLPGYEDFPTGRTLGPVDSLKTLSSQDRLKYLLEKLPELRAAGWITDEAARRYEKQMNVRHGKVLLDQLDDDLRTGQITSEVADIIRMLF